MTLKVYVHLIKKEGDRISQPLDISSQNPLNAKEKPLFRALFVNW